MHTWFYVQLDQKILDGLYCTGVQHNQATQPSMPILQCPKCNDVQVGAAVRTSRMIKITYKVQTVYGFSSCAIIMAIIGFFHSKFNLDHQKCSASRPPQLKDTQFEAVGFECVAHLSNYQDRIEQNKTGLWNCMFNIMYFSLEI